MIIIPMAGKSSRFFNAGYTQPKFMLKAHGKSLFAHSVLSFKNYFESERFLFIIRDNYNTKEFVLKELAFLGVKEFDIVTLNDDTDGQAQTVVMGLEALDKAGSSNFGPITVFNIDTFRKNFLYPVLEKMEDGYLEVFRGTGDNWSFAKPLNNKNTIVMETAEKNAISDLCSTGLYYFKKSTDFLAAYYEYLELPRHTWEKGELYIAPLYNILINKGLNIHYNLVKSDDVVFCGKPNEYLDFLNSKSTI